MSALSAVRVLGRTVLNRNLSLARRSFSTTLITRNEHIFNVQDSADFQSRVLKNEKPVLVDFHADWCGPCKLLGPRLEKAISAKDGKVLLAKIDVDELDDLAAEYNIRSLPTVMAFKNGVESDRFIGLQEDDIIDSFVEKASN